MEEISSLMQGFAVALTPYNVMLMLIGIVLGVIIGVLPGLGGANGVAILLPLTFTMPPTSAIIMLSCIYWGALFGGAITSILFNIPGEPWSVATTFDGHPMAQQGRAGEALTAAFTSSFVGALVAVILITFLAPVVAKFALKFGPAEFFAVFFLTFASFIGMGKGSPFKVVAAMCLGFALGAVGLDKMTGTLRMTFGHEEMLNGFDFLIAVIGLFGIGEILTSMESGLKFSGSRATIRFDTVLVTWKKLLGYWATSIRSCIIGCWMGITPGGATPASFMSYGLAKRFSKNGHNFGKGEIEGVIAPETAAHAAGTSALLPMLTLGIPGSPTAAVLLGGLMIWGLQPGPMLFVEQKDFVWGLIASMYLGNVVGLIVVLTCVPLFAAILRVPFSIIAPVILVVCAIGAYTVHNSLFDVWMMLGFGVLGYVFQKLDYPLPPLVLAIVLGDKAEEGFRQALLGSQGSLSVFWSNPLVGTIMGLGMILLFWPLFTWLASRFGKASEPAFAMAGSGLSQAGPDVLQPIASHVKVLAGQAADLRLTNLRAEHRDLAQRLAAAGGQSASKNLATLEELEAENRRLRAILERQQREN
jgi:putative tricarboxylic transport membrane protein